MRKGPTTLVAAIAVGATVPAVGALAGAAPGDQHTAGPAGDVVASGTPKGKRVLFTVLKGRNEIGTDGRRGAGDANGRGGFTGLVAGDQLCFGLTVDNIDAPVAAHIHRGRRNENGPIVVSLTAPDSGDPGASSGCVPSDDGDAATLREIVRRPGRFYVNVHTAAFPNGAVRGQLKRRP